MLSKQRQAALLLASFCLVLAPGAIAGDQGNTGAAKSPAQPIKKAKEVSGSNTPKPTCNKAALKELTVSLFGMNEEAILQLQPQDGDGGVGFISCPSQADGTPEKQPLRMDDGSINHLLIFSAGGLYNCKLVDNLDLKKNRIVLTETDGKMVCASESLQDVAPVENPPRSVGQKIVGVLSLLLALILLAWIVRDRFLRRLRHSRQPDEADDGEPQPTTGPQDLKGGYENSQHLGDGRAEPDNLQKATTYSAGTAPKQNPVEQANMPPPEPVKQGWEDIWKAFQEKGYYESMVDRTIRDPLFAKFNPRILEPQLYGKPPVSRNDTAYGKAMLLAINANQEIYFVVPGPRIYYEFDRLKDHDMLNARNQFEGLYDVECRDRFSVIQPALMNGDLSQVIRKGRIALPS